MKRLFFMVLSLVLFMGVLPLRSVEAALSYTAGPDASTPHYVTCSTCNENYWSCTESAAHSSGVCENEETETAVCRNNNRGAGACSYSRPLWKLATQKETEKC